MLHVTHVRCAIPDERPSLFQLRERYAVAPATLMVFHRVYGLDQVPVWRESIADLICTAVERLIEDSAVAPEQIAWLVHAHTSQQLAIAGEAMLEGVCRRLGLRQARVLGMTTNNCASAIAALPVIEHLLAASDADARAVLVTADIAFTPVLQSIPNSSVTGDAAAACLLGRRGPGHALLASRVDVYGQHARCQWQLPDESAEFDAEYPHRLAHTMTLTLEQAGLGWRDVRWVIPHNVNTFSWKKVARCAGIPLERIYLDQVPRIAHCFGADIFLNWRLAEQEHRFQPGDYLLLATVGLGAVFAAALVRYGG